MEIEVYQQQGRVPVTIFTIRGDIDAQTYDQLQNQVQASIQAGARNVLLDMAGVNYISSYGVRALSQIYDWLRDTGETPIAGHKSPHVKLVNVSAPVSKVLETTGMDLYLDIYSDRENAIATF